MSNLTTITSENFDELVLKADQPILIDFWAPWCGPCKTLTPVVEGLAPDYADRVTFSACNVDQVPDIASRYGVRGIPTLVVVKNGKVEGTKVGILTKQQLMKFIDQSIAD